MQSAPFLLLTTGVAWVTGIEPAFWSWEPHVLPLDETQVRQLSYKKAADVNGLFHFIRGRGRTFTSSSENYIYFTITVT